MVRRLAVTGLLLLASLPARAAPPAVHDFGESGKLARLYRAPDQKLHLLYVTPQGFRWHIWQSGTWTDRGLVPGTQGQGASKFNNPAIVALADGSFHVAWGPVASWGASHDVWLMSHDGNAWGPKQTIRPDYTEYLALAPLPGNQILLVAGIVCPSGCTTALPLAYSAGKAGQAFGEFVDLPIAAPEAKTPFVAAQPGSDAFHLVYRWAKLGHRRWDGAAFGPESLLGAGKGYSIGSPVASVLPDGSPVVAGVAWKGSGTTWTIDHVRLAQGSAAGWLPSEEGEHVAAVVSEKVAVSADANGGVHLFYFAKAGELTHRFSKNGSAMPPEVLATGVEFTGPETDNLAAQYTDHHVHVIAPIDGTLRHLAIDTSIADGGLDAPPEASPEVDASEGGGPSPVDAGPGSTTPAEASGCGCRMARVKAQGELALLALATLAGCVRSARRPRRPAAGHSALR